MAKTILRLALLTFGAALLVLASCRQAPGPAERGLAVYPERLEGVPDIRVLVRDGLEKATLAVTGPYRLEVEHIDGRVEKGGGEFAVSVALLPTKRGLRLGQDEVGEARILPRAGTTLSLDGQPIPGAIHLSRVMRGTPGAEVPRLRVIATVGIEAYLVGVVAGEIPPSWPAEALRAQAIAARTYALYRVKTREKKPYDVKSTVMSQVWKPSGKIDPRVLMAVNSTRGIVLTENWKLFPAYYSSRCGGYTANARYVFLGEDHIPLSGTSCPYCLSDEAPRPWRFLIGREDLSRRLARAGLLRGKVLRLRALDENRNPLSGMRRVYIVEVSLENGTQAYIPAADFRLAVGYKRGQLESTYFQVAHTDEAIVFEGVGHGHGVGLCQYGAWYMAERQGRGFEDILEHYYRGAELVRLWSGGAAIPGEAGTAP